MQKASRVLEPENRAETSGLELSAERMPTMDEKLDIIAMMVDRIAQQLENIMVIMAGEEEH